MRQLVPLPPASGDPVPKKIMPSIFWSTLRAFSSLESLDRLISIDYTHAIWGYAWYNNASPTNDATTYYNRNGIPALMWHWGDPSRRTEEFNDSGTTFDANKIYDPAFSEYRAMIRDIDFIAGKMKVLQDQRVAVL